MSTVRRKHTYLAIGVTAAIAAVILRGFLGESSEAAPEPGYTHVVAAAPVEDTIIATGVVRPAMTVELRSEASGLVDEVLVREGDVVRRGEVLVRLSSGLATAAVDEAEAQLRQAHLQEETASLDLDQEALDLERRAYARAEALFERGLFSRNDLEQHRLTLRLGERTFERNRKARRASLAHIEQARANVARAKAQLDQMVVRAPFDATVLKRSVDVGSGVSGVGQSASGGTVLMTLGDSRRSAFYASVTAADSQRLQAGMPARIGLDAVGGGVIDGEVHLVSGSGEMGPNGQLATFPIVVALATARRDWVNVPARAEIVLTVSPDSTVVPAGCIRIDEEGRSYALLETPAGPERRDVELGAIEPNRLEVRSGLIPGQEVRCQ
jgi:HlyD family secretion protein